VEAAVENQVSPHCAALGVTL